jgi:hypothetical protein
MRFKQNTQKRNHAICHKKTIEQKQKRIQQNALYLYSKKNSTMASNLRHRPMPSLPFCPSCNDTEMDDDESHEPISQSEYIPSELRGDASVGSDGGINED